MKLTQIDLANYRNIRAMSLAPCGEINVVFGDNAQGKTNLMEAIWLFTGNPSFRGAKSGELVAFGEEAARLDLRFCDRQREQRAHLSLGARRRITLNGVELKTAGELNGNFYAVVFSPSHLSLVQDGPKHRRHFLDIAISEIKPQYKSYLNHYEKLVEQRNALLRNAGRYRDLEDNIEVWDRQLAKAGTILSIYRGDYVRKLRGFSAKIYEGLSSAKESFSIRYESTAFDDIDNVTIYESEKVEQYYGRLKETFAADVKQGFTGIGVHRDDLDVLINGISVKTFGSQGQQRSSVIALKLAEAKLLQKATGEEPVMLLDDVMSELDISRQTYILNHLKGMQVFITCCDPSNAMRLETDRVFHIHGETSASSSRHPP